MGRISDYDWLYSYMVTTTVLLPPVKNDELPYPDLQIAVLLPFITLIDSMIVAQHYCAVYSHVYMIYIAT